MEHAVEAAGHEVPHEFAIRTSPWTKLERARTSGGGSAMSSTHTVRRHRQPPDDVGPDVARAAGNEDRQSGAQHGRGHRLSPVREKLGRQPGS